MGGVQGGICSHQPSGLGSGQLLLLQRDTALIADHSFEAPVTSGVVFHDLVTVSLGGVGTINHVINETGGPSNSTTAVADLTSFP